jgi:hypothetical protein
MLRTDAQRTAEHAAAVTTRLAAAILTPR